MPSAKVFLFCIMLGTIVPNASLQKSPTIHTVYGASYLTACRLPSRTTSTNSGWPTMCLRYTSLLRYIQYIVGDMLYCTTMYCIYALQ